MITTAPGEEGQVDYGDGPDGARPETGKYRRTRLFVLTLGYTRKSVRLLVWRSSAEVWARAPRDGLSPAGRAPCAYRPRQPARGRARPDIYEPTLNPLYRDVLAHYGVVALPCRVRDPDRKGKVESGVGHAQQTPLRGLRFETLEAAQAYLDRWETRWADTRIHGTTKRQVAAMFAEEQAAPRPLPARTVSLLPLRRADRPSRRLRRGRGRVLRGAAGLDRAARSTVQWDELHVRLLDPATGQLLREHLRAPRGWHRIQRGGPARPHPGHHRPAARPRPGAGPHIGAVCAGRSTAARRRRRPRASSASSPSPDARPVRVDDAAQMALELGVPTLPLPPPLPRAAARRAADPSAGRSAHSAAHPLPRSHRSHHQGDRMNLVELDHALRKLRLSGMAAVLEPGLRQAQTEKLAPLDLVSTLVSRRTPAAQDRLLARRLKQAAFRDTADPRSLRFRFQQEDEPARWSTSSPPRASSPSTRTPSSSGRRGPGRAIWRRPSATR